MAKIKFDAADEKLGDGIRDWLTDQANANPKKGLPNLSNLLDVIKKILSVIFGLSNAKVKPEENLLNRYISEWVEAKKAARGEKGVNYLSLLMLIFKIFEAVFADFNNTSSS